MYSYLLYLCLYVLVILVTSLLACSSKLTAMWLTSRDQRSYSTPGPVSTWMGDRLQTGEPSRYVTSHPGQLSLAIPPWVGTMSIIESWGVNRHTAQYTSPVSVVSQCKLLSGWGLRKTEISAALWALVAWEGLYFFYKNYSHALGCDRFIIKSNIIHTVSCDLVGSNKLGALNLQARKWRTTKNNSGKMQHLVNDRPGHIEGCK